MKSLIILLLFTKLLKAVDDVKYYEAIAKISREVAKIYTKNPQTFPNVGISDTCECGCGKKVSMRQKSELAFLCGFLKLLISAYFQR